MKSDRRDLIGGVLMTAVGIFAAVYAVTHYDLGEVSRLGPGAFPAATGLMLTVLGGFIAVPAWRRGGSEIRVRLRPIFFICAALACFTFVIGRFGLVPAIATVVTVSALAEPRPRWREALLLTAALSITVVAVFRFGLGIEIPLVRW